MLLTVGRLRDRKEPSAPREGTRTSSSRERPGRVRLTWVGPRAARGGRAASSPISGAWRSHERIEFLSYVALRPPSSLTSTVARTPSSTSRSRREVGAEGSARGAGLLGRRSLPQTSGECGVALADGEAGLARAAGRSRGARRLRPRQIARPTPSCGARDSSCAASGLARALTLEAQAAGVVRFIAAPAASRSGMSFGSARAIPMTIQRGRDVSVFDEASNRRTSR